MNLKQHLEEIDKRFDKKFVQILQSLYGGEDQENEAKGMIKSFIHTEAIELVKKAFEETMVEEKNDYRPDMGNSAKLIYLPKNEGWNDARSSILEKQKKYLENF